MTRMSASEAFVETLAAQGISRVDGDIEPARQQILQQPWWLDWTAGLFPVILVVFLLRSFLFGLSPADPVSYVAAALVIGAAAIVATAVPVRRALRVDPAITLRAE